MSLSDADELVEITGTPEIAALANGLSDLLAAAMRNGLSPDVAVGVGMAVVADYGRGMFGDGYLETLAHMVMARGRFAMPDEVVVQ